MDTDFCSDENVCGQTLLKIVSRGNAVIAELLRLSKFVPSVFFLQGQDKDKYEGIIFDFKYFSIAELCEKQIDAEFQELDSEFKDNHIDILTRFYLLFESIYKYIIDLKRYLEDLEEGIYIQQNLEKVILKPQGKQLMVEALYLYSIMLLTIDKQIPGVVRERMIVSCYRYLNNSEFSETIDHVCKLLRSTKYIKGQKLPANYPEEYFSRVEIPEHFVDMVLSRLRYDDIYDQISAYPSASHRSTALATQASMLYCILYFKPELLKQQSAIMREIVDKFFSDNWVISLYMGQMVNLAEVWEPYKAARLALQNSLDNANIKNVAQKHLQNVAKHINVVKEYLVDGVLTEQLILTSTAKLISFLREANVSIRWCTLHTIDVPSYSGRAKKIRDMIVNMPEYDANQLFILLLHTAQLEFILKSALLDMIKNKEDMWKKCQADTALRLNDLSTYFSGEKMLQRVEKNQALQDYFANMAKKIQDLVFSDDLTSGRKIVKLIQGLEEVQEFHQMDSNLPVLQVLKESRDLLYKMIRCSNISDSDVAIMQVIGDLSYAWENMDVSYTTLSQKFIKADPALVDKVRALFVKLSSTMELPLLRIVQANSPDMVSVSQYYSRELVAYVRKILQIIPETMFKLLDRIVHLQTHSLKDIPCRLDKEKVKEYAFLEQRFEVAKCTHKISVFAEGILAMKSTLVGIVTLDPKQLLEDGIRKELVRQVANAMDATLKFEKTGSRFGGGITTELVEKLEILQKTMKGFRRSFEYIQDYVNIYGLKIWQEEVSRIIRFNIEQECNSFLTTKVYEWESHYQSTAIPIPKFQPSDSSVNFIGRMAREILRLTDARSTIYIDQMSSWYDYRTNDKVVSRETFLLVEKAVGTFGLGGLDRLYSFMIVKSTQDFVSSFKKHLNDDMITAHLAEFKIKVGDGMKFVENFPRFYANTISKIRVMLQELSDVVVTIGQIQLLRRLIQYINRYSSKLDSKALEATLSTLNGALMKDIKLHYRQPNKPYPNQESNLLPDLSEYLTNVGIGDPFAQIYLTTGKLDHFAVVMFLIVISQISKCNFDASLGTLVKKNRNDNMDGIPFVVGVITILKQFHDSSRNSFLCYISQYIRAAAPPPAPRMTSTLGPDIFNCLVFLDHFCRQSGLERNVIKSYIPSYIFDEFYSSSLIIST